MSDDNRKILNTYNFEYNFFSKNIYFFFFPGDLDFPFPPFLPFFFKDGSTYPLLLAIIIARYSWAVAAFANGRSVYIFYIYIY
jgi:hypothetical protein